jgi:hypothetical protein
MREEEYDLSQQAKRDALEDRYTKRKLSGQAAGAATSG